MPRDQREFRTQCAIVEMVRFHAKPGLYVTAIPNGEYRSPRTGARLKRMGVRAGAPDLLLLWNNRAIGLEIKTDKGRSSPEQLATERDWIAAGGLYFVARGYRAAVEFLEMLGCITPVRDPRWAPRELADEKAAA